MSSQLKRLFLPYAVAGLSIAIVCGVLCGYSWLFGPRWSPEEYRVGNQPIPWKTFSKRSLNDELARGRSVLVNFRADWDIATVIHERTSLEKPSVRRLIFRKNITPLIADWTDDDKDISNELQELGEISIPRVVIYSPQKPPKVLRDFLTEKDVVRALEEIPN